MSGDRSQRTETPTAKRLNRARKEGDVPRTKELAGALGLLSFLTFGHVFGADWLEQLRTVFVSCFSGLARSDFDIPNLLVYMGGLGSVLAILLAMPLTMLVGAVIAGNLVQGPPPFSTKPFHPNLNKLNPVKGIRKVVQLRAWIMMLRTALKLVLFSWIAVAAVRDVVEQGLAGAPGAEGALAAIFGLGSTVVLRVALVAMALAVIDLLYQRYEHSRKLRMTKQEVRDERKESEGDPLIKARVRSKQMTLARSRMMADVSEATVVVTNPTHFAVALRYVPEEMDVPRVLAKGRAKLAERIRDLAREHGVPIVNDPPLARALYRAVEVGSTIPTKLFRAVAEVLAMVLRRHEVRT